MALAISQLQARIEGIENQINTLQTSINSAASRSELKDLVALVSAQVTLFRDQADDLDSTGAINLSRYTSEERDALTVTKGAIIHNTTLGKIEIYTGSDWETITST